MTKSKLNRQIQRICRQDHTFDGSLNLKKMYWLFNITQQAVTPRDYYVPIGSEALYRGYAEVLLGRPAQSQEELDSMNLMVNLEAGTIFRSPGFTGSKSRYIKQNCLPQRVPANQFLCLPLDLLSSRGTNTSGISKNHWNLCIFVR
jgi:hypothetical protein